jgi:hypothetical protein
MQEVHNRVLGHRDIPDIGAAFDVGGTGFSSSEADSV